MAVQFTVQTHGRMKCKIFIPAYIKGGRTYGSTDDFLRPQISWVHRQGCQNAPASSAISGYFKGFAPCNLGNIPTDKPSPTWKQISLVICLPPTWVTHIPSDMCSPTLETRIPSDLCSTIWKTHIPCDMFFPNRGNTYPW